MIKILERLKWEKILLLTIILVAIFFRFYNTPYRYSFGSDSIRDALVAVEGAKEMQLPLTGSFSSLGPFTFGPWYYYQLILFSFITHLDFAPWIYMGLASVAFVYLMYKIGENLEGKTFGIILGLLVAFSPAEISTATELSNPNLVPLFSALSIILFIKLIKENTSLFFAFLLGLSIGIGINIHYQMLGFIIFPILLLIKKKKRFYYFFTSFLGIFVSFIPLLLFDLNNHWFTVRNLFFYYTQGRNAIYVPNRWLFYLRDFWPTLWAHALGVSQVFGTFFILVLPFIVYFLLRKKKYNSPLFLLIGVFLLNFVFLRYYWGSRSFSYLQYMYPFIFIFTSYCLWFIYNSYRQFGKFISIVILTLLLIAIAPNSFKELSSDSFNPYVQSEASTLLKLNENLSLYNCKVNYEFRTEALVYLLNIKNRISDSGRKIGFKDYRCSYPPVSNSSIGKIDLFYPAIGNTGAFDISRASDSARAESGWDHISPKVIYNSTVRWWFNEQP